MPTPTNPTSPASQTSPVSPVSPVTAAQQRVLDLLTQRGYAEVSTQTNPALGTVHNGSARALQDRGLVRIWQRQHNIEAVLPGSERDHDIDGIA